MSGPVTFAENVFDIAHRQAKTKAQKLGGGPFDATIVENALGVTSTAKVANDFGYHAAWPLYAMLPMQTESGPHYQICPCTRSTSGGF